MNLLPGFSRNDEQRQNEESEKAYVGTHDFPRTMTVQDQSPKPRAQSPVYGFFIFCRYSGYSVS